MRDEEKKLTKRLRLKEVTISAFFDFVGHEYQQIRGRGCDGYHGLGSETYLIPARYDLKNKIALAYNVVSTVCEKLVADPRRRVGYSAQVTQMRMKSATKSLNEKNDKASEITDYIEAFEQIILSFSIHWHSQIHRFRTFCNASMFRYDRNRLRWITDRMFPLIESTVVVRRYTKKLLRLFVSAVPLL